MFVPCHPSCFVAMIETVSNAIKIHETSKSTIMENGVSAVILIGN